MDAITILDNYRLSVLGDKELFLVLSSIYKDDSITEEKLSSELDIPLIHLKGLLTKLFRANLIKNIDKDTWRVSPIAEKILGSVGVSTIISQSILKDSQLNNQDTVFLGACISSSADQDSEWLRDITVILKAYTRAFQWVSETKPLKSDEKKKALYALIIGTNPAAKELDTSLYCDKVSNAYVSLFPEYSSLLFTKKKQLRRSIANYCMDAISDFKLSNELFLTGPTEENKSTFLVALTRVIANLLASRDASDLGHIYSLDKNSFIKGVETLFKWRPNLASKTEKYIFLYYNMPGAEFVSRKNLTSLIKQSLMVDVSNVNQYAFRPYLIEGECAPVVAEGDQGMVLSMLSLMQHKINSGKLDSVDAKKKNAIIKELRTTEKIARSRFKL